MTPARGPVPAVACQVGACTTRVRVRGPWSARAATAQTTCLAFCMERWTWTPAVRLSGCQPRCARGTGTCADQACPELACLAQHANTQRRTRPPLLAESPAASAPSTWAGARRAGWALGIGSAWRRTNTNSSARHNAPLTCPSTSHTTGAVVPAAGGVEAEAQPRACGQRRSTGQRQQLAHQPAAHPGAPSPAPHTW